MPFFKQCLNTEFAHSITYSWISQNFHAKLVSHTLARLRTLPHDRPLRTDTRRAFVCQFYTAKVFFSANSPGGATVDVADRQLEEPTCPVQLSRAFVGVLRKLSLHASSASLSIEFKRGSRATRRRDERAGRFVSGLKPSRRDARRIKSRPGERASGEDRWRLDWLARSWDRVRSSCKSGWTCRYYVRFCFLHRNNTWCFVLGEMEWECWEDSLHKLRELNQNAKKMETLQ